MSTYQAKVGKLYIVVFKEFSYLNLKLIYQTKFDKFCAPLKTILNKS